MIVSLLLFISQALFKEKFFLDQQYMSTYVNQLETQLNMVFQLQNITLSMNHTVLELPCITTDLYKQLDYFAAWKHNQSTTLPNYHLYMHWTKCLEKSGVAFIGVICSKRWNVAVVNGQHASPTLFAHELGHNFGLVHHETGIMSYGDYSKRYLEGWAVSITQPPCMNQSYEEPYIVHETPCFEPGHQHWQTQNITMHLTCTNWTQPIQIEEIPTPECYIQNSYICLTPTQAFYYDQNKTKTGPFPVQDWFHFDLSMYHLISLGENMLFVHKTDWKYIFMNGMSWAVVEQKQIPVTPPLKQVTFAYAEYPWVRLMDRNQQVDWYFPYKNKQDVKPIYQTHEKIYV